MNRFLFIRAIKMYNLTDIKGENTNFLFMILKASECEIKIRDVKFMSFVEFFFVLFCFSPPGI